MGSCEPHFEGLTKQSSFFHVSAASELSLMPDLESMEILSGYSWAQCAGTSLLSVVFRAGLL